MDAPICLRRGSFIRCAVLLGVLLVARSVVAREITEFEFNIERQQLQSAVKALATTGRVSIGIADQRLKNIQVGPVRGRFGTQEALLRLVMGTDLAFTLDDAGNYEIVRAQEIGRASSELAPRRRAAPGEPAERSVTVVATRIDAQPFAPLSVIFDSHSIDQLGYPSLGAVSQFHALPESVWGDGGQYADLHGLGVDASTVTINGRWAPVSASSGVAFDLNAISLSAVDHVEVLPESAAAERGVRAIGGVIDISLRRMPSAPIARVEYGVAAGGGAQRQMSLGVGMRASEFNASVLLDFFERDELPGESREFWRNQDFSRFGGSDWRSRASWPGNISSATGRDLPGLPSSYAAVPIGTSGNAPQISDFELTAGQLTLDSSRRHASILPAARRMSIVASADGPLGNAQGYAELIGVLRRADYRFTPPTLNGELVPATNAYSPFDEPVYISRLLHEFDARHVNLDSQWLRFATGLSGQLKSWTWELNALHSTESAVRWANNALDQTQVARALASPDPQTALNVFQEGPVGSTELLNSLIAPPNTVHLQSNATQLSTAMRGRVLSLDAGDVIASLSATWREESAYATRAVTIGQGELFVPLLRDVLGAHVSARWDRYSDVGRVFTSGYALKWQPLEPIQASLFYGTSFRPPSIQELAGPIYTTDVFVVDRQRRNEVTAVTVRGGSSSGLDSVRSESTALSVKVTPSSALEIEGVYWLKRVTDRIVTLPLSLVLDHEDVLGDHIVRDPPSAADLTAGRPGALRSIDVAATNLGRIDASGVDGQVAYQFNEQIGTKFSAAWIEKFDCTQLPGSMPVSRIGVANAKGTIPRWRLGAALYWQNDKASTSLSARYVPSYDDAIGDRRTGRHLRSQIWVDYRFSLDLERLVPRLGGMQGVTLSGGVLNVLDSAPQFSVAPVVERRSQAAIWLFETGKAV